MCNPSQGSYGSNPTLSPTAQAVLDAFLAEWAALATPPPELPEPPTDEEIEEWADAAPYVPSRYDPDPEIDGYHRCFDEEEFGRTIRAALERWGK